MANAHIDPTRIAALNLLYEVEATLKLLEQLPQGRAPSSKDREDLEQVLEFRGRQVDEAVAQMQGCLSGAMNAVRLRAQGGA